MTAQQGSTWQSPAMPTYFQPAVCYRTCTSAAFPGLGVPGAKPHVMVCSTWMQFWGGSKSRSQASLAGATTVQWHVSSSASWGDPGSRRSSPRWKTSAEDPKTSSGGHPPALQGLACPQHQPWAWPRCITPLRTAPGSQPASLCSAIFKTPKENSHLRLLETWRVPPAICSSQEPCSFSNPPELALDIKPNKQTERGLLCKKVPPN